MKEKIIKIAKRLIEVSEDLLRLSKGSLNKRSVSVEEIERKWYEIGVKAGSEEFRVNLEKFTEEELEEARDEIELVELSARNWERSSKYFFYKYGEDMREDIYKATLEEKKEAPPYETTTEIFSRIAERVRKAFWEGYIEGRKQIGIDVYERARKALREYNKRKGYL